MAMKELLLKFFENSKYPGWKNIAEELIDSGYCIAAGNECIWIGGIGNFITTKKVGNLIDCLEYHFSKDEFIKSAWFQENLLNHVYKKK